MSLVERLNKRIAWEMCSFGPNKPDEIGANDGPNWMRYLPKAEQITKEAASRIAELEAALKPFAELDAEDAVLRPRYSGMTADICASDVLAARAALGAAK